MLKRKYDDNEVKESEPPHKKIKAESDVNKPDASRDVSPGAPSMSDLLGGYDNLWPMNNDDEKETPASSKAAGEGWGMLSGFFGEKPAESKADGKTIKEEDMFATGDTSIPSEDIGPTFKTVKLKDNVVQRSLRNWNNAKSIYKEERDCVRVNREKSVWANPFGHADWTNILKISKLIWFGGELEAYRSPGGYVAGLHRWPLKLEERFRLLQADRIRRRKPRGPHSWPHVLLTTPLVSSTRCRFKTQKTFDPLHAGIRFAAEYLYGERRFSQLRKFYRKVGTLANEARLNGNICVVVDQVQQLQDVFFLEPTLFELSQKQRKNAMDGLRRTTDTWDLSYDQSRFYANSFFHIIMYVRVIWCHLMEVIRAKRLKRLEDSIECQSGLTKIERLLKKALELSRAKPTFTLVLFPHIAQTVFGYNEYTKERFYEVVKDILNDFLVKNPTNPLAWRWALKLSMDTNSGQVTEENFYLAANLLRCNPFSELGLNWLRKCQQTANDVGSFAALAESLVHRIEHHPNPEKELWRQLLECFSDGSLLERLRKLQKKESTGSGDYECWKLAQVLSKASWWDEYYFSVEALSECSSELKEIKDSVRALFFAQVPTIPDICEVIDGLQLFPEDRSMVDFEEDFQNLPQGLISYLCAEDSVNPKAKRYVPLKRAATQRRTILEVQNQEELRKVENDHMQRFFTERDIKWRFKAKGTTKRTIGTLHVGEDGKLRKHIKPLWDILLEYNKELDPDFKEKRSLDVDDKGNETVDPDTETVKGEVTGAKEEPCTESKGNELEGNKESIFTEGKEDKLEEMKTNDVEEKEPLPEDKPIETPGGELEEEDDAFLI